MEEDTNKEEKRGGRMKGAFGRSGRAQEEKARKKRI